MMFQLSEEQRGAVELEAARLTIIAPPGCGKTEVLAHRVAFLIDILEPGQKTLALTFTNRAKANLMDRLRQTLGVARVRRYVSVQNFHGHATSIILSHGRTLGLDVAKEHQVQQPEHGGLSDVVRADDDSMAANLDGEVLDTAVVLDPDRRQFHWAHPSFAATAVWPRQRK